MMNALMTWGKDQCCVECWLGTEAGNQGAIAFYKSMEMDITPMVLFEDDL
jgi:hypothetical protein